MAVSSLCTLSTSSLTIGTAGAPTSDVDVDVADDEVEVDVDVTTAVTASVTASVT